MNSEEIKREFEIFETRLRAVEKSPTEDLGQLAKDLRRNCMSLVDEAPGVYRVLAGYAAQVLARADGGMDRQMAVRRLRIIIDLTARARGNLLHNTAQVLQGVSVPGFFGREMVVEVLERTLLIPAGYAFCFKDLCEEVPVLLLEIEESLETPGGVVAPGFYWPFKKIVDILGFLGFEDLFSVCQEIKKYFRPFVDGDVVPYGGFRRFMEDLCDLIRIQCVYVAVGVSRGEVFCVDCDVAMQRLTELVSRENN